MIAFIFVMQISLISIVKHTESTTGLTLIKLFSLIAYKNNIMADGHFTRIFVNVSL